MSSPSIIWVGIAGPSQSGKSTLSRQLSRKFRSPALSITQDMYFCEALDPTTGEALPQEVPASVDYDAILHDMEIIRQSFLNEQSNRTLRSLVGSVDHVLRDDLPSLPQDDSEAVLHPILSQFVLLFIEGHLLFANPSIANECSVRLWIDVSQDVCRRRRLSFLPDYENSVAEQRQFDEHIWAPHLRYRPVQLTNLENAPGGFGRIGGSAPKDDVVEEAIPIILDKLQQL